jgi:hypothetical protein
VVKTLFFASDVMDLYGLQGNQPRINTDILNNKEFFEWIIGFASIVSDRPSDRFRMKVREDRPGAQARLACTMRVGLSGVGSVDGQAGEQVTS